MDAAELRYGNYVYCHYPNGEKVIHQHSDFSEDIESMEPIPLTREFCNKHQLWDVGGYELTQKEDAIFFGHEWEDYYTRLKYFHQLQNLYYALTGYEIRIDL